MERLLKIAEVAERVRLSRSTLYELMGRGELRAMHIGRVVRIPESELERWIAEQYAGTDDPAAA